MRTLLKIILTPFVFALGILLGIIIMPIDLTNEFWEGGRNND